MSFDGRPVHSWNQNHLIEVNYAQTMRLGVTLIRLARAQGAHLFHLQFTIALTRHVKNLRPLYDGLKPTP